MTPFRLQDQALVFLIVKSDCEHVQSAFPSTLSHCKYCFQWPAEREVGGESDQKAKAGAFNSLVPEYNTQRK